MYKIILNNLDEILPLKCTKIRIDSPAWFTKEVLNAISYKNKCFTDAKNSPDDTTVWHKYRSANSAAKKAVYNSKATYIKSTLNNNSTDPKKFWSEISKLMGTGKDNSRAIKTIRNETGHIVCDTEAAEYMNDYYVNIGTKLAEKSNSDPWRAHPGFPRQTNQNFSFRIITEKECFTLIKQIDISKSSSTKNIKTIFLKDAFLILKFEITYLLNQALRNSEFPESWGCSIVTPIPKDGDHLDPGNWRPISQMPLIGRLLEKAVHTQLVYYINSVGLLHYNQHGFRANKSTGSAIFQYIKKLFTALDNNQVTGAVYIDYKKAFDTISHDILLKKLRLYGFSADTVTWFQNYLSSRSQSTLVNSNMSRSKRVKYGVPQGSTLGPTLFIIFVNDLFYLPGITEHNTIMYADDTVLYISDCNEQRVMNSLQGNLEIVTRWCTMNLLTINESKTKYCLFNRDVNTSPQQHILLCKGQSLGLVSSYKYLGADIASDLNMDDYVSNVYNKSSIKIHMLSKIRRFITTQAAILIYKQTILPYLDYASFLMDSAYQYSLSLLDKIQKRGIRLIEYEKDYRNRRSTKDLMSAYGLQSLRHRRDLQLLTFMYNESLNADNLNLRSHNILLRSSNKIKFMEKLTRKTSVQNSPYYRGIALWNCLSESLQKEPTLVKFKNKIKGTYRNKNIRK